MGYTIPNATNASVIDQSEPDSGDFVALGNRKTGVISGCAVTAKTVNSTFVDIAAGEVISNGVYYTIGSTSLDLGSGTAGSARFDLVVVNSSGSVVNRDGSATAGSNPTFPTLTDGDVFLAAVYRAAGTSDVISSTRIIDKRITTPSNVVRSGTGAPDISLGNVGDIYVNTAISSSTGQSQVYLKSASNLWENLAEYYPMSTSGTSNVVLRDGSGNFSAGTITATTFSGALSGNATTASAFNTTRTVSLSGNLSGSSTAADGNHTISATIQPNAVTQDMIQKTSVPQQYVSTNSPTGGKANDIWIKV